MGSRSASCRASAWICSQKPSSALVARYSVSSSIAELCPLLLEGPVERDRRSRLYDKLGFWTGQVLIVADLFEPVDGFAVELFLDGDVGHGGVGSGAVPMFFAGREPDHVAGADFFDGAAPVLGPAAAGGDDQRLAERVRVPGGACAGLEGDAGSDGAGRGGRVEEAIDAHGAGEVIGRGLVRSAVSRCV